MKTKRAQTRKPKAPRTKSALPNSVRRALLPKSAQPADCITVLLTGDEWHKATKQFVRAGNSIRKIDYNAGYLFGVRVFPINDIEELSAVLSALEPLPRAQVIRGVPTINCDGSTWVRRTNENFSTPPQGHHWLLIDIDDLNLPKGLSLARDADAVCEYVIAQLPKEFHNASCHWQLSSSAGMKKTGTVSLHLWFFLRTPATDAALKEWAKAVNARAGIRLIDTALFQHVQIHYTAAPIFDGVPNPFPVRSGLKRKKVSEVELRFPPPPPPKHHARAARARRSDSPLSGGFEAILSSIGDHKGGDGFHEPIIRAAASYVGTHGAEGTDVEKLYEMISLRVLAAHADPSKHGSAYVERMASREHIVSAIESAIKKFGGSARSRRKSRLIEGVSPHFTGTPLSALKASEKLKREIDEFFS